MVLIIIIIFITFFRRVFSEFTEAVTTSLIQLDEICAFVIGFSLIVCTKIWYFVGLLADDVQHNQKYSISFQYRFTSGNETEAK